MISALTYAKMKKEINSLIAIERDIAARAGDEVWKYEACKDMPEVKRFFENQPLLDMMCYEISDDEAMDFLEQIRKDYRHTHLVLMADSNLSPMTYLKPGIMADALLLRPWSPEQAKEILWEVVADMLAEQEEDQGDQIYVIENRDGKMHIPFNQIFYFEAREKKIFACTGKEEYGFYRTIEQLEGELPGFFVRCHRSYIVNKKKIRKVSLSQSTIFLSDGLDIPLSRSYKPILKGFGR